MYRVYVYSNKNPLKSASIFCDDIREYDMNVEMIFNNQSYYFVGKRIERAADELIEKSISFSKGEKNITCSRKNNRIIIQKHVY